MYVVLALSVNKRSEVTEQLEEVLSPGLQLLVRHEGEVHSVLFIWFQLMPDFEPGKILNDVGLLSVVKAAPNYADVERVSGLVRK